MLEHLKRPKLSVIVIVYKMVEQAKNTLYSLSSAYQAGVDESDYEVITVENESDQCVGTSQATQFGRNFRYFLREETQPTPVNAINFGFSRARGKKVAIVIDGARMLTPGVIQYTLQAHSLSPHTIVSVPGYHLGEQLQQITSCNGYNEETERGLLARIEWPNAGYRLFEIACFSGSCREGFFQPHAESNFISLDAQLYRRLGGFDARFDGLGGGYANLDFYKRACELPGTRLVVLAGEGTFHQYHGGATTSNQGDGQREKLMEAIGLQYINIRGRAYEKPAKEAMIFGPIPENAQHFVKQSIEIALKKQADIVTAT